MPGEALDLQVALGRYRHLLFDTSVLIDEFKRPSGRLGRVNIPQRATSVVAVWEFLHGRDRQLLPARERRDRRGWLDDQRIVRLPITAGGGKSFESLIEIDGPPGLADVLLAAECLARGVPCVTRNVRDFAIVAGLRYVAW
ncbi:MAG: type II toxin-antitoxin system VapC family toxin [Candidatus Rokubacteria bacterium]|nr:type II toxin-antitoxin system VapC family toxin [Candidatus Rokubacteria bacterium]